ncbi:MAG: hypothetical protein QW667_04415 [Candidatus Bathyarchaeia archaeon]
MFAHAIEALQTLYPKVPGKLQIAKSDFYDVNEFMRFEESILNFQHFLRWLRMMKEREVRVD